MRSKERDLSGVRSVARALVRRMTSGRWLSRSPAGEPLSALFGPLECEAIEALWRRGGATNVRGLQDEMPGVAYTTLMTTLDRLYKKGVLDREKRGQAFYYAPRFDRQGLRSHLASTAFEALLGGGEGAVRPLLSCFVEAVSRRDEEMLDELARLVRARRRRKRAGDAPGEAEDEE